MEVFEGDETLKFATMEENKVGRRSSKREKIKNLK
jgi:hypothetical protein